MGLCSCREVGGVWLSLFPLVPSSEVDVSVYIPFFYFSIFFTATPFPQHLGPWTPRWTTKTKNGSPISPLYLSSYWVDRMKSNCGFLRFAGEVRFRATTTCWFSVSHLNLISYSQRSCRLKHAPTSFCMTWPETNCWCFRHLTICQTCNRCYFEHDVRSASELLATPSCQISIVPRNSRIHGSKH